MATYKTFKVDIVIEADSDLDKRIQQIAKENHCSVESVVTTAVGWGIYHHMESQLALMERSIQRMKDKTSDAVGL